MYPCVLQPVQIAAAAVNRAPDGACCGCCRLAWCARPPAAPIIIIALQTFDHLPTVTIAQYVRCPTKRTLQLLPGKSNSSFTKPKAHALRCPNIYAPKIPNTEWTRLGAPRNLQTLLQISGIETNPGPSQQQTLSASHININSITAEHKMDELHQFISANDIKILALTETKLDDTVSDCLYHIDKFHAPLTKHRTRHGGGVALYVHSSLAVQRLKLLEIGNEEWIWAKVKTKSCTLIICCLYLPPNSTSSRLDDFINNFSEAVCQSQRHAPTTTLILGDFNAGNAYLDGNVQSLRVSSGTTPFDFALKDAADALGLHQLIRDPTRISTTRQTSGI